MSVDDNEFHVGESSLVEVVCDSDQDVSFSESQVDTEHFWASVVVQPGCDHDRFGHDPAVLEDDDIGGVEPHVGARLLLTCARAKHCDVGIEVIAGPAHGRLRHPGVRCRAL